MLLLLHHLLIFSKMKDNYRNGKKCIIRFILLISHKIWKFWAICDSDNYPDTHLTYAQPKPNRESFQNERIIVHFMINYPYINFLFFLHIHTSTTGKPAKSCTMNSIAQFTLLNNTTETTKTFKNEWYRHEN